MRDPESTPRPSATWAAAHERAIRHSREMRETALLAIDALDFGRAVAARRLQLHGEALAEQTTDWQRLAPENPFRQEALSKLFAYSVDVEALLKGET